MILDCFFLPICVFVGDFDGLRQLFSSASHVLFSITSPSNSFGDFDSAQLDEKFHSMKFSNFVCLGSEV